MSKESLLLKNISENTFYFKFGNYFYNTIQYGIVNFFYTELESMKKISKEEWLKAGMNALSLHAEEAIRIDKLCAELNVSKGSFYHHFQNIENYVVSLMTFWEKENTIDIIESAEEESNLENKTEKLNSIVIGKDHLVEVRIRSWAVRDAKVKLFVDKVDGERMEYLKSLYLEHGLDEEKAWDMARLEYASFIGMQHLFRDAPIEEKQRISQLFQQLLKTNINEPFKKQW